MSTDKNARRATALKKARVKKVLMWIVSIIVLAGIATGIVLLRISRDDGGASAAHDAGCADGC